MVEWSGRVVCAIMMLMADRITSVCNVDLDVCWISCPISWAVLMACFNRFFILTP